MATSLCSCNGAIGNTGYPNFKPFGVTNSVFLVPLVADDGTRNKLDGTSSTLGADLLAMVNNADPSKRAYPIHALKNVTHTEADPIYETADNTERFKVQNGVKTLAFEKWGVTNQWFGKLQDICVEFGVYLVDNCGNVQGDKDGDNLYPRAVNQGSYDAMWMDATATTSAKATFQMDYRLTTTDGNQWMIAADAFGDEFNPLYMEGLIDVNITVGTIAAGTMEFSTTLDYGYLNDRKVYEGATLADIEVFNVTTDSVVTPDSLTASSTVDGDYTLAYSTGVTAADELTIKVYEAATEANVSGYESKKATWTAV